MKKITFIAFTLLLTMSNLSFGQTYYSENFDGGTLNGWTTTDLDGDSNEWAVLNAGGINSTLGTGALVSFSYDDNTTSALTPDNLATSPAIDLTAVTASNLYLFYDQLTSSSWPGEHYAVYLTTSNDPAVITAATPIFEVTNASTTLVNKYINVSSYIGQTVYLSFRHFNCTDKYYLILDNVVFKSLANYDVKLVSSKLNRYSLTNTNNALTLTVKNQGVTPVTNLTINWNDGTDHISTITKSIASQATSTTVIHPTAVNYATLEDKNIAITITAVNTNTDANPADNTGSIKFNTISQNSLKKVFFEEGTGTWCGWCPRGAVAMDYMETTYPTDFVGVAVHNQDPMMITEYDSGADFSGFPGMNVDRSVKGASVTQAAMVTNYNTRKAIKTPVSIDGSGTINGADVVINAAATFRMISSTANYRLGVIVSEDNVTGTDTGYNQTNYYANNANGAMGGYESLPSPVPAADMVYNHVGRALLGGYSGQENSVPTSIADGQVVNYTFNYTKPDTSDAANMHAVILLIDQDNGEVVNSTSIPFSALLGNKVVSSNFSEVKLYPNPATDNFNIQNLKAGNYTIAIYDLGGKLVQKNDNKTVRDNESLNIPFKNLSTGEYMVNISTGKESYSTHLLVK